MKNFKELIKNMSFLTMGEMGTKILIFFISSFIYKRINNRRIWNI